RLAAEEVGRILGARGAEREKRDADECREPGSGHDVSQRWSGRGREGGAQLCAIRLGVKGGDLSRRTGIRAAGLDGSADYPLDRPGTTCACTGMTATTSAAVALGPVLWRTAGPADRISPLREFRSLESMRCVLDKCLNGNHGVIARHCASRGQAVEDRVDMSSSPEPSVTVVVRLACDGPTARQLADALADAFDAGDAAVAAFERPDGGWSFEAHFAKAPDEATLRALVDAVAGEAAAQALVLETVAARDWVAASLAGLKPVAAGRFLVHGAHDRAYVPAHRIGIEIEAALAFGTGHHGTTRGCLLALDAWLKRRRHSACA